KVSGSLTVSMANNGLELVRTVHTMYLWCACMSFRRSGLWELRLYSTRATLRRFPVASTRWEGDRCFTTPRETATACPITIVWICRRHMNPAEETNASTQAGLSAYLMPITEKTHIL